MTFDTALHHMFRALGDDPTREGLRPTSQRFEKLLRHMTEGQRQDVAELFKGAVLPLSAAEQANPLEICFEAIPFAALCEHYLMPFYGTCMVRYTPDHFIIGAGRVGKIIDHLARRLQLQEGLTHDIAQAFWTHLQPKNIEVILTAEHMCVRLMGGACSTGALRTVARYGTTDSL